MPALWAVLQPLYFSVHDDMHPAWVFEMYQALTSGQMPPRWAPNLSFGYGYPLFNFIYPLPYYLAAPFYAAGLEMATAVQAVQVISLIASGVFMYLWARNRWNQSVALVTAVIYMYTPYRALDIYVRGAIGESVAFVFLPLIGWAADLVVKKNRWRYTGLLGLAAAGLLLAHNITAMAMVPLMGIYSLAVLFDNRVKVEKTAKLISGWLLGGVISAYFWLPALIDKHLMQEDTLFNFRDHFPFIKQLIYSPWKYGASVWGPGDDISFQMGLVNWVVLLGAGLVILFRLVKRKAAMGEVWMLITAGLGLFLMNIRSAPLWDMVPIIAYFQFPWRLLFVTTLATAFLAGTMLSAIGERKWLWLLALVPILATFPYFRPDKPRAYSDETIFKMYYAVPPDKPEAEISADYLNVTEEYLRLPKATKERPQEYPRERITVTNKETKIEVIKINPVRYEVKSSGPATELEIYIYNFPGWRSRVDGQIAEIKTAEPHGDIRVAVAEGEHRTEIYFEETPRNRLIDGASLLGLTTAAGLIIGNRKKKED